MVMRHFTAIHAVAVEKSLSKAAKKMYITQQALSKTIKEAETECGREIFKRTNRGLILTADGERLLSIIRPLLNEYDTVNNRIDRFINTPVPDEIQVGFGIGTMYSLGYKTCIDMQNALLASFPEYSFTFSEFPDLEIEELLKTGALDLAISLKPSKYKDLMFNSILSVPITALIPSDHPFANKEIIRIEELKDCDFILPSRRMQFYEFTIQKCLDAGFMPKIRHECMDATSAMYLVQSGEGVFLGINVFLEAEGVKKVKLDISDFDWVDGILYTKQTLKDPISSNILRIISDSMRTSINQIRSHENIDIVKWHDNI